MIECENIKGGVMGYTGAPKQQRQYVGQYKIKLSQFNNLNPKTIAKWKRRSFTKDVNIGPKQPKF